MGLRKQFLGLLYFAAGDKSAGALENDAGVVEWVSSRIVSGFPSAHRPVQQCLSGIAVAAGECGVGGLPEQKDRHRMPVAVE